MLSESLFDLCNLTLGKTDGAHRICKRDDGRGIRENGICKERKLVGDLVRVGGFAIGNDSPQFGYECPSLLGVEMCQKKQVIL